MHKLAPLTKLLFTVFITFWALILQTPLSLGSLLAAQFLLLALSHPSSSVYKAAFSLLFFSFLLGLMQYWFTYDPVLSFATAAKMAAMTFIFLILLATTRMQDLTAALVSQCRVPYEYAFMITAALRFIPDLLAESKAIQEAQLCRGLVVSGNPISRILAYTAVLKPLILQAVGRSETMALALELRGFGSTARTFYHSIALKTADYLVLIALVIITVCLLFIK